MVSHGEIILVQNKFFTTEARRKYFLFGGEVPAKQKNLLSFQNRNPMLHQSALWHLWFSFWRDGSYDPIAVSRLDHKKFPSVDSVPPW